MKTVFAIHLYLEYAKMNISSDPKTETATKTGMHQATGAITI